MKLITILSEQLQKNEIIIPIKYEPKLIVRNDYYKRYELQKLIILLRLQKHDQYEKIQRRS